MKPAFVTFLLLIILGESAFAQTSSPRRQLASAELKDARRELQSAKDDTAGKRKEALKLIDRAIGSIDYVLNNIGEKLGAIELDPDRYPDFKDHVPLRRALTDLNAAHGELAAAQGDRWGLRRAALDDIQKAIDLLKVLLPDR